MSEYKDERDWGFRDPGMEDLLPYTTRNGKKEYLYFQIVMYGDIDRNRPMSLEYIRKREAALREAGRDDEIGNLIVYENGILFKEEV